MSEENLERYKRQGISLYYLVKTDHSTYGDRAETFKGDGFYSVSYTHLDLKTFGLYPSGNKVTEKPEILFARLDLKEVLAKVAELHPPKAEEPAKEEKEDVIDIEAKPEITFEDFGKLQFRCV